MERIRKILHLHISSPAVVIGLIIMLSIFTVQDVYAVAPYKTFTLNYEYGITETQSAYEPFLGITKIGDLSMREPQDMRLGSDGLLYIADTGNKRIIVSTLDGELVRTIGENELKTPKGVFVTDDLLVYVADESAGKVFVYTNDGEFLREISRPTHPLFGLATFKPQKIVVDKRGNLYITSSGNTNGIIQLSPNNGGEFLGYFGANETRVNALTIFRKTFFSEESLSRLADVVPITITNLDIDNKGLIYTVSQGDDNLTLKKLNMAGKNIFHPDVWDLYPAAVTTNDYGNVFMASKDGLIYEFSSEGNLIFIFGSRDDGRQRVGLFNTISALVADHEGKLYALDSVKNDIQVFVPTEFANLVHEAFALFDQGRYLESKEPWKKVIEMNSLFSYANVGLGEALFREENYSEALQAFRLGGSKKSYSDTFWELRSEWMHDNLIYIISGLALIFIIYIMLKFFDKRYKLLNPVRSGVDAVKNVDILRHMSFMFHNIKNPSDTAYGIRFERKASVPAAAILLFVYYILFVWEKYFSGFLFKRVSDGYYDLVGDAFLIIAVVGLATICCYLVCTITEGEAKFKFLFIGFVFSLAPIFMLKPLVIIFTNVLTDNESVFIAFTNFVAYTWTGLLIFLTIKNLNDYSVKKTIWTIFLTLFTAAIVTLVLFVVYILISQVIEFISAIFGEAVYRLGFF